MKILTEKEQKLINEFTAYMKEKHGATDFGMELNPDRYEWGDYFMYTGNNSAFRVWKDLKGYA